MSKLSDAIWVTRKCHIHAEERLNRRGLIANVVLTAYSTYLVVASLIALKIPLQQFELVSLSGAILVLVASVFVWGLRFSERAGQFKASYIRLHLLLAEAQSAEFQMNEEAIASLRRTYADILQSCENHSKGDYLKLRFELRSTKDKTVESMSPLDYTRYWSGRCTWFLIAAFILFAPAIGLFWYVCRS